MEIRSTFSISCLSLPVSSSLVTEEWHLKKSQSEPYGVRSTCTEVEGRSESRGTFTGSKAREVLFGVWVCWAGAHDHDGRSAVMWPQPGFKDLSCSVGFHSRSAEKYRILFQYCCLKTLWCLNTTNPPETPSAGLHRTPTAL